MTEAEQLVSALLGENLDSLEGAEGPDSKRYGPRFRPTPGSFHDQWPRKPEWHPGHRSSRMSMNRNLRRRSFGYSDVYSLRDRGWPYANRGYDLRKRKYERELARHGQVEPGEGI